MKDVAFFTCLILSIVHLGIAAYSRDEISKQGALTRCSVYNIASFIIPLLP